MVFGQMCGFEENWAPDVRFLVFHDKPCFQSPCPLRLQLRSGLSLGSTLMFWERAGLAPKRGAASSYITLRIILLKHTYHHKYQKDCLSTSCKWAEWHWMARVTIYQWMIILPTSYIHIYIYRYIYIYNIYIHIGRMIFHWSCKVHRVGPQRGHAEIPRHVPWDDLVEMSSHH